MLLGCCLDARVPLKRCLGAAGVLLGCCLGAAWELPGCCVDAAWVLLSRKTGGVSYHIMSCGQDTQIRPIRIDQTSI
eukprot:1696825-Lingulodinium_polyedra.AAC.1